MCEGSFYRGEIELIDHEVPYEDGWNINCENVRLLGTIGEGAFGRVLKAKACIPRLGSMWLTVAVKTLKGRFK
jgi:hypothetical protein